jgi:hypothetical protein
MRTITLSKIFFSLIFILSSPSFAADETPSQSEDIVQPGNPEITKIVEEHVALIKKQKKYDDKHKQLVELIDLTNKEFSASSNSVTDLKSKIIENDGNVDDKLITEKNKNESIYNSWVIYKVALEPNYELFVEKNDKYHCDVISDEIWQSYSPTGPTEEKVELDSYTKNAVKISVEIAEDLCKSRPKKVLAEN